MDFSVALTLIQTLLQLLSSASPLRREIESVWGYKSQLDKLTHTISIIQAVLLEAEHQQRQQLILSRPLMASLERLNHVLYHADDLFDEVATLVQRKNLMSGNNLSKEVRIFFSHFNQFYNAFSKSHEIKKIRETLDDIARDHSQFGSMISQQGGGRTSQVTSNPRETGSMVCEEDVFIGRDEDKRVLIDMLLDTSVEVNVSCVTIIGIGGLGKTTLAQHVYNDERIKREFQLKMWVCVSNEFDVKSLLGEILAAATKQRNQGGLSIDLLQTKIKQELHGKKYLLVLDDVWGDVTSKWDQLRKPLIGGGNRGSRILLTTRLMNMADTVGGRAHELKGLSEADSWTLFERMTLKSKQEMEALNGGKILNKCANVPLAIRVIGSLLRGQDKSKWSRMENIDLATESNGIMPVLAISYYDLPFHLKRCFNYCAMFPKDHDIIKEDLVFLWMAQGFIQNGPDAEDVGEGYFMDLLQRCFFQDVKRDDDGEIISCKMHDLIHDLAKKIAGTEMVSVKHNTSDLKAGFCHLFIEKGGKVCSDTTRLRTLINQQYVFYTEQVDVEFLKVKTLRALSSSPIKVSNMIGELMHLRYLDLSHNFFTSLSPSITNLFNLQTLKLSNCGYLRELPSELGKLVNLRCLDLFGCSSLTHMPPNMRGMTCLHKLTSFVLGKNSRLNKTRISGRVSSGGLEDLKCLNSLTGTLKIEVRGSDWSYDEAEVREGGFLSEKEHLKGITMDFHKSENDKAEALLKALQPNHNLQMLKLSGYPDIRFPSWGLRGDLSRNLESCLSNLVEIRLFLCSRLKYLPLMSKLPKLRVVQLEKLSNLEYVEYSSTLELGGSRQGEADDLVFFPSLKILELKELPMLKGWKKASPRLEESGEGKEDEDKEARQAEELKQSFPQLIELTIEKCGELTTFPLCPKGGTFNIDSVGMSGKLWFRKERCSLKGWVEIDSVNVEYIINSLPTEILQHLPHLDICDWNDTKTLATGKLREVFRSCHVSSLRIGKCMEMRRLSDLGEIWGHLTALESLELEDLPELELDDEDVNSSSSSSITRECKTEFNDVNEFDIPWRILGLTLRSLSLCELPRLVKLPAWIGCFSSLKSLTIDDCPKLKSLPEEMRHLTTLETLKLDSLDELELEVEKGGSREFTSGEIEIRRNDDNHSDIPSRLILPPTLCSLSLWKLPRLVKLPAWIGCLSSLKSLTIDGCPKLKSLPEEMQYLTTLETLKLVSLDELELEVEKGDSREFTSGEIEIRRNDDNHSDIPSRLILPPTLCFLRLFVLPKLVKLPRWMDSLTSLNSLEISYCNNLEELPAWIGCFTSLQSLTIKCCANLKSLPGECATSPLYKNFI